MRVHIENFKEKKNMLSSTSISLFQYYVILDFMPMCIQVIMK